MNLRNGSLFYPAEPQGSKGSFNGSNEVIGVQKGFKRAKYGGNMSKGGKGVQFG